ncbi:MAG: metal-dependent transcriptional regulator [Proteobacteria bacterium]|nr:metal-dependent transcriptional regulator [Pseudomonadota bacterium]
MMSAQPELTATMEDYLEAICGLQESKGIARVKDIAKRLRVRTPTVSGALQALVSRGLVTHEPYKPVVLTRKGLKIARETTRRHEEIKRFLIEVMRVPEKAAERQACEMEHVIDRDTLDRLVWFSEFVRACSCERPKCLQHLDNFLATGEVPAELESQKAAQEVGMKDGTGEAGGGASPTDDEHQILADMRPGEKGVIVRVAGRGPARRRLLDMGVTTGTPFEVERVAPLGDPVEIKLKGYHLSLRKEEAARIHVDVPDNV